MESRLPHQHCPELENISDTFPSAENFLPVSEIFKQLSDPTRARIFWLLCHGEECVVNIGALMQMSSPAVSHHLRLLKSAGLITSRRVGKEVYYTAAGGEPAQTLHTIIEQLISIVCPLKK